MARDLANRVAARNPDTATAAPAGTLEQQIRAMREQYQLAMPKGMEAAQLVRDALTAVRNVPKLAQAHAPSVLGALMTCAQLGLRPNTPLGLAWVLPFWNARNRRHEAQVIIGYQGYLDLARRSGAVLDVVARTVHENDVFDIDYGLHDNLIHKPNLRGDRGEPIGYYAIVRYANGGHSFWHMTRAEVEAHRDRFAMARTREGKIVGPWVDHFEAMALKSTVRGLARWMPKTVELAVALAADERVRVDLTPDVDESRFGEYPALPAVDDPEPEPTPEPVRQPASKLTAAQRKVGTRAWHDADHPRVSLDGTTVLAATDLTGDCGFCEQDNSSTDNTTDSSTDSADTDEQR